MDVSGLSARAIDVLTDSSLQFLVSPISTNEIAIKVSRGKLHLSILVGDWVRETMRELDATELPLTHAHASLIEFLPWHHRDPFDRLLIAQALAEDLRVLRSDRVFEAHGVARVW